MFVTFDFRNISHVNKLEKHYKSETVQKVSKPGRFIIGSTYLLFCGYHVGFRVHIIFNSYLLKLDRCPNTDQWGDSKFRL